MNPEFPVLVCGDRNWTSLSLIRVALWHVDKMIMKDIVTPVLIHGACRGADLLAATVADGLGWRSYSYPADWNKHGKAAGPIRNREMYNKHKPSLVYAFHNNFKESKGTRDMVNYAIDKGSHVVLITENKIWEKRP